MRHAFAQALLFAALTLGAAEVRSQPVMPRITVSGGGFVFVGSGAKFTPWGFNYDRDWEYRLIEDYWGDEWAKVEEDFAELRALGANVVRICLQYHRFMDGPRTPNETNLTRLRALASLAERHGIYLDIAGLGSFRPSEDPPWYVALSERERWAVQAMFWAMIAETLADSPAVFAFNLMNEPVVPGERLEAGAWVAPDEIEGLHYVQFISLDPGGRERAQIAVAWVRQMTGAIRAHDPDRLMTVGMFPLLGSVDASGFSPMRLADEVDFISVHLYPQAGRVDEALALLKKYEVGLPVLIEEIFPIDIGMEEYRRVLEASRTTADGWLSFYWGETAEQLRERPEPLAGLAVEAIEEFERLR